MKFIDFLVENKLVILPFAGLIWSEILSLNPAWKSNGLVQLADNAFKSLLKKGE